MKEKKKFRLSILLRIASLFLIALIVSALVTMAVSHRFMMEDAARQARDGAEAVATAAKTALGSKDTVYALMEDDELRDKIHRAFRYICSRTRARYLYLYTIDENDKKHYIVLASDNEEDDRVMNEEYGFGSTNTRPVYDAERNVLNGDLEDDYEFIDNDYGDVCMYVVPVRDKENHSIALIGVDYGIENITDIARNNTRILFLLGALVFGIAFVSALELIWRLVIRPLSVLSGNMQSFVKNRRDHVSFEKRRTIFEDEITDIEGSFEKMAGDITQYVDDIEQLAEEKSQNQAELDIARKIQNGIIPMEYSLSGNEYEIYGCEHPAREVGGDFYDIFRSDENNLFVVVGDISGKGVSAAMFMVMVRTSIREKLKSGSSPAEALNRVNREICVSNPENMFATVFALMFNTKTGVLRFANAGHTVPVLLKSGPEFLKMRTGTVLGLFEDALMVDEEIQLDDGEGILVYTDGITEAVNKDKKHFGSERLRDDIMNHCLANNHAYSPRTLVCGIVSSVNEFSEGLEQFDDITCIALVYSRKDQGEITPDIASFQSVKRTIIDSLGDNERTRRIILACEEIFANIVSYSQADNVYFSCKRSRNIYSVTFSDNGIPFDPVNADIRKKEFEELDTGGMGIMLARENSKEMIYNRMDDRNVLTLSFEVYEA